MNTKVAVGLVAAIILAVVAFFIFHKGPLAPAAFTSSAPTATTSATNSPSLAPLQASSTVASHPAPVQGVITPVHVVHRAAIDQSSLVSHSMNPVITGTSNLVNIGIVIDDPSGTGIIGAFSIPVVQGHWTYTVSRGLPAGLYTVHLIGNDTPVTAKLIVIAS